MKLLVEQSLDCNETEIKITCGLMDERLKRLIEQIRLFSFSVTAEKDGVTLPIAFEDIYYFDTVDNKTFLYVERDVYRCEKKLYELEAQLENTPFIRISKNCISPVLIPAFVITYAIGYFTVVDYANVINKNINRKK